MSDKIIGIDLGTTNSVVAVIKNGIPLLIPVDDKNILPSVVGISPTKEILVGYPARNQWVVSPENTVRSVKRKMGKTEKVSMAAKEYTPQEISAFILKKLKESAEEFLQESVSRAVITVPAYFNELQRQATIEAGEIAGLKVERIINEPTASALAYGLNREEELRVLVYDLGGGTFDVSVIELNNEIVDVLATAGDNHLGGDDFDEMLAGLIADEFLKEHKVDLRENHYAWARLLRAAEEAKIELSSVPYSLISLEYIAESKKGTALHIRREVKRDEFESLIAEKLESTIKLVDKALTDAELTVEDIDRVLLVGGSTRSPIVWELISEHMKQEPHIEIDPDAAVALGAAVQAGIITGEEIDAILVDVTPLSLGIECAEISFSGHLLSDRFEPLIRHNTTIPVQQSKVFTTVFPGQDKIHIKVYQGEETIASKNVLLGDFFVEDLKPNLSSGHTEVTVNFSLDVNAILDVTVVERKTGAKTSKKLKASRQKLSAEDIAESQAKLAALYHLNQEEDYDEDYDEGNEDEDFIDVVKEEGMDPGTKALLERAKTALANPEITSSLSKKISDVVEKIKIAIDGSDSEQAEGYCDELIDLLMDAEE